MTVTIEGKTIINHHDPEPLAINYFGFATRKDVYVQFYYNCTSAENDDPDPMEVDDVTYPADIQLANLGDRLLCAVTPVVALIVFQFGIACTCGLI